MKKSYGFTLVELLIAITIIAILSVLGLNAYQGIYKTGQDAKRKSDLKMIQSALEQYHADQHYYPPSITPGAVLKNPDGSKTYLTTTPKDPAGSPEYSYVVSGTSYCLYAKLNSTLGVNSDTACPPQEPYNFGITRP